MNLDVTIGEVKDFWDTHPCQSDLSAQQERARYFDEISARRFRGREWHVPIVAAFKKYRGKDLLEIGCGIGTDGFEFATNGARYVGIDLTPNSIQLAQERFELFGVEGRFEVVNAEEGLPFSDASFDHVYSFGVIHHSPNPEAIVDEMYRVLKSGGTFSVMLYNRTSINYYVEIMFLRRLFRYVLLPHFMPRIISRMTGFAEWKLAGHRRLLLDKSCCTREEWVSINTDGPTCPLARVYNRAEAAKLFRRFRDVRQEVWEFNTEHWSFIGKMIPRNVAYRLGRAWGWHRMVYGRK